MLNLLEFPVCAETIQSEIEELRLCLEECHLVLLVVLRVLGEKELELLEDRGAIELLKDLEDSVLQRHRLALGQDEQLLKELQGTILH